MWNRCCTCHVLPAEDVARQKILCRAEALLNSPLWIRSFKVPESNKGPLIIKIINMQSILHLENIQRAIISVNELQVLTKRQLKPDATACPRSHGMY